MSPVDVAPRGPCLSCEGYDPASEPDFCRLACRLQALDVRSAVLADYRSDADRTAQDREALGRQLVQLTRAEVTFAGRLLASEGGHLPDGTPPIDALSPHMWAIMLLAGDGFTNKEMGHLLTVSPHTVRNYLSTLLLRLDMANRTELAAFVGGLRTRLRFAPETIPCLPSRL